MKTLVSLASGAPDLSSGDPPDLILCPDRNLLTGLREFREFCDPTSLEIDLLHLASAVFACDIAQKRGERENVTRNIELKIPVVNFQAFNAQADDLAYLLYVLSHDNWTLTFVPYQGQPEAHQVWSQDKGKTLLFSGGLDSLAGAVDLIDAHGVDALQLASHQTGNTTNRHAQIELVNYLTHAYGKEVPHLTVRTGGRPFEGLIFPNDDDREGSQRTRSFMFLTIGALAARRTGKNQLVMLAENGQMAIHLPLSAARIGAFSTHTAHPEFIALATDFFCAILNYPIEVENFYLYKTKAEVVAKLVTHHQEAVRLSTSCWKNARLPKHCGQCIPCYVRRVALEFNGLHLDEYEEDVFSKDVGQLPQTDEGKRNLMDFLEFACAFRNQSEAELIDNYPEIQSDRFEVNQALDMYRRFAQEAYMVLQQYPFIVPLM